MEFDADILHGKLLPVEAPGVMNLQGLPRFSGTRTDIGLLSSFFVCGTPHAEADYEPILTRTLLRREFDCGRLHDTVFGRLGYRPRNTRETQHETIDENRARRLNRMADLGSGTRSGPI